MDLSMKHLLSLLAICLMATPAFADTVVEIKSVELKATKADGKPWDVKIPMRKGSELPDIMIEVVSNSKTVFKTAKQKDTLKASFSGQKFSIPNGSNAIIKVWDMDAMGHDSAAEIPYVFSGNEAQIDLNRRGAAGRCFRPFESLSATPGVLDTVDFQFTRSSSHI